MFQLVVRAFLKKQPTPIGRTRDLKTIVLITEILKTTPLTQRQVPSLIMPGRLLLAAGTTAAMVAYALSVAVPKNSQGVKKQKIISLATVLE